ncbi:MAG: 23S rRNA (pseudouridine(1915)-N(3))-methyltransferase RlmH [Eubacteriales bacterium]
MPIKIKIICVGKLKEKYYLAAQQEYQKMLLRFAQTEMIEVADEPLSNVKSETGETAVLAAEAQRILPHLSGHVIVCDLGGEQKTSEEFAAYIKNRMVQGDSEICFVIGGSIGLSTEIKRMAALRLSVSRMTMPHRLFRIVLVEQIYRAFKILNGETYHK